MKTDSVFTREVRYPVLVSIPNDLKIVTEHGVTYVEVVEPFMGLMSTVRLSLKVAADRGLVTYTLL